MPPLAEASAASIPSPGAKVLTHAGMRKLRPADYMEVISALQPDAYVAIADEFYSGARTHAPPVPFATGASGLGRTALRGAADFRLPAR